jgi:starch synthase
MVLPSLEEGMAMVQAQALACGCPVIASTNTGGADLFTDGREGYVVPIRDPTAIAERLTRLHDDPALLEEMSAAAVACVSGIGGWDQYGANSAAVFTALARARGYDVESAPDA